MKVWGALFATMALVSGQGAPAAASPKSNFPDLEQKLGKGWQCFAMPNGFGHVGVIFEQRQDQQVFYLDDTKRAPSATAAVSIGTLTTSKHFSLAAAVELLSAYFPSLDASYDHSTKISATIGGAEEQVGGVAVTDAGKSWAASHLSSFKPGSKLFIVREAVVASEITYAFDAATSTSITAKLALSAPRSATVPAAGGSGRIAARSSKGPKPDGRRRSTVSPPDANHRIAQTFDPKIGICIHPDQIVLGNNYGGSPKPSIVPVTQDLEFRTPTTPQ